MAAPKTLTRRITIEVCVDSVESALIAEANGADRLELCANLAVGGGTTASIGLITRIVELVHLPIMALVRCRTGHFVYTEEELSVMRGDILAIRDLSTRRLQGSGAIGIVIGASTPQGGIDMAGLRLLIQAAGQMPITFHRAFDMVADPEKAVLEIAELGNINRILTSGLAPNCMAGLGELLRLTSLASAERLRILPGSGIKSSNVETVLSLLVPVWEDAQRDFNDGILGEIHLSAGHFVGCEEDIFRRNGMGFGLGVTAGSDENERERREWGKWKVRVDELREVRRIVDKCAAS